MSWSTALSRVRFQGIWTTLTRRAVTTVASGGRLPGAGHGRGGLGAALAGHPHRSPVADGLGTTTGQQQCRGMAASNHKHKKILKLAKGLRGRSKSVFKIAIQRVEKGLEQAYRDRKNKKRDFRRLWIERINAGVRQHGMPYSMFVNKASKANVELNRKVLAELAVTEPYSFRAVVETVKAKGSGEA